MVLYEVRLAARGLIRSPVLTVASILILALGIGMTGLMFSLVYGAIFRGLPFPQEERILRVSWIQPGAPSAWREVCVHDYGELRDQLKSLEDLAAVWTGTVNVSGIGRPVRYSGAYVTPNGFESLRARPAIGRAFREDEGVQNAALAIILGHHVWVSDFGADPHILGRTLRVNGEQATIVGVMPEGFKFPDHQDVWLPYRVNPVAMARGAGPALQVYGRLAPGLDREQAAAELEGIARRIVAEHGDADGWSVFRLEKFSEPPEDMTLVFLLLLASVVLVLLVACVNVANLLLARAAGRVHELALTMALGARRWRVVTRLMAEALMLVTLGAVLGVAFAWLGLRLVLGFAVTSPPPFWFVFTIDTPILLFVLAASTLAALVAGLIPGVRLSGTRVHEVLKDQGPGTSSLRAGRLGRLLVVAELALSVGLLVPAGLLVKGMVRMRGLEHGVFQREVLTARVGLFEADFPTPESRQQFFGRLHQRLTELPGIDSAAMTTTLPGLGSHRAQIGLRGTDYVDDRAYPQVGVAYITPEFFDTFRVGFVSGRDFTPADDMAAQPVAIVNQSFVQRFFPGGDAFGRQLREGTSGSQEPWRTIVGVVPDLYMEGLTGRTKHHPSGVYIPAAQSSPRFMSIALRGQERAEVLASLLRAEVEALSPDTPIFAVRSMARAFQEELWYVDLFGGIFAVFGGLALLLAAGGLYAVMATGVEQRRREMGIRIALGAGSGSIARMVLGQAAVQVVLGLVAGLGLAAVVSRGLTSMLFGVEPFDVSVFAVIALVMLSSGLSACLVPARRATGVDPVRALRVM